MPTYPPAGTDPWYTDMQNWLYHQHNSDGSHKAHPHVKADITDFAHTHPSTDVTDFAEAVDDRVSALLQAGSNVTLTYDDVANTLTIASTASSTAATTPELVYSTSNTRSSPQPLDGASVSGTIYIFVSDPNSEVAAVDFYLNERLDRANGYGGTDTAPPFDFLGDTAGTPNGWDTTTWPGGPNANGHDSGVAHEIRAVVTYKNRRTETLEAVCTVRNGAFLRTVNVSTTTAIDSAIDNAVAGDDIVIASGTYLVELKQAARKDGTAANPIRIRSSTGNPADVIIDRNGSTGGIAFELLSSYYYVEGITFTNAQTGVYNHNADLAGSSHNLFRRLIVHSTGQAAFHPRQNSSRNIYEHCTVYNTGTGTNPQWGEGYYVGTDEGQWDTYMGATSTNIIPDECNDNIIRYNLIYQCRGDMVEVKTGCKRNTVYGNTCDALDLATASEAYMAPLMVKGINTLYKDNTIINATRDGIWMLKGSTSADLGGVLVDTSVYSYGNRAMGNRIYATVAGASGYALNIDNTNNGAWSPDHQFYGKWRQGAASNVDQPYEINPTRDLTAKW